MRVDRLNIFFCSVAQDDRFFLDMQSKFVGKRKSRGFSFIRGGKRSSLLH